MASLLISVIMLSIGVMSRLTANIAPTPAKAAAIPARGCLPRVMKAAADSGIRIRYPASEAMLERTPTKMRMKAMSRRGATATSLRISAPIIPACSATPTPIMATKTTATTAKPAKLSTNEVNMNRIPSTVEQAHYRNRLGHDLVLGVVVAQIGCLRVRDVGSAQTAVLVDHLLGWAPRPRSPRWH